MQLTPIRDQTTEELSLGQHSAQSVLIITKKNNVYIVIAFVLIGFYFLIAGTVELITNAQETLYNAPFQCTAQNCQLTTDFLTFDRNSSIAIYLKFTSIPAFDRGLLFNLPQQYDLTASKCHSVKTNQQMHKNVNIDSSALAAGDSAIPCGRYASYYPQGAFTITAMSTSSAVSIKTDDLASSIASTFSNVDSTKQWADMESERFRAWMECNSQLYLEKFWGVIENPVSDSYTVALTFSNPIPDHINSIQLSLHDNSALGGYNFPLLILSFVMGCIMFVAAAISFVIGNQKVVSEDECRNQEAIIAKLMDNSMEAKPKRKLSNQFRINQLKNK